MSTKYYSTRTSQPEDVSYRPARTTTSPRPTKTSLEGLGVPALALVALMLGFWRTTPLREDALWVTPLVGVVVVLLQSRHR